MAEMSFTGYAGDCVVRGRVDAPNGTRLTDFVSDAETLNVRRGHLLALEDGRSVQAGDFDMTLDELFAVEADSERGAPGRRIRTRTRRVLFELGPYRVLGQVHAPPTADPVRTIRTRKPMVPVTDVLLTFTYAGERYSRHLNVLIVNRDRAHVVEAVTYEPNVLDHFAPGDVDPRAKDLTGDIYARPGKQDGRRWAADHR